jgi:hypothetical protein
VYVLRQNCRAAGWWRVNKPILESDGRKSNGESVKIVRGVRQGCVLSPLLFNIYSEHIGIQRSPGQCTRRNSGKQIQFLQCILQGKVKGKKNVGRSEGEEFHG